MRRSSLLVLGACAASVSASLAYGQVSYDPRLAFAAGWNAPATPITEFLVASPGTYEFTVLGGIFDAQNFHTIPDFCTPHRNFGVGMWQGDLASSEGTLEPRRGPMGQNQARVPPFNFGPAEETITPTLIGGIDAARGTVEIPWPFGEPVAPLPPENGAEEFTRLYRFQIEITDLSARDIVVTASGTMIAIGGWGIVSQTPPVDENTPGFTQWAPCPAHPQQPADAAALTIRIIPAPGATLVIAAGWLGARRRRP
jgi:hypothetical protein